MLSIQFADGSKQLHATRMLALSEHLAVSTATFTPANIYSCFLIFVIHIYIFCCPSCTYRYTKTALSVPTGTRKLPYQYLPVHENCPISTYRYMNTALSVPTGTRKLPKLYLPVHEHCPICTYRYMNTALSVPTGT